MKIGEQVGRQFYKTNRKRREIARINVALCFPEKSTSECELLVEQHFLHYGRSLVDMGIALWGKSKRVNRVVDTEGVERLRDIIAERPVILITYHLTTLEMLGSVVGQMGPCVCMMNHNKDRLLTWQQYKARKRFGDINMVMRAEGLRGIIKGIRERRYCVYLPDEDFGDGKHAEFAPFFGVSRATLNTTARLARSTGSAVVPVVCYLDPKSGKYRCVFSEPIENYPGENETENAVRLNAAMEEQIRVAPEHYLWTFRWFRTRPDGLPDPYKSVAASAEKLTT